MRMRRSNMKSGAVVILVAWVRAQDELLSGTEECAACDTPPDRVCAERTLPEGDCLVCSSGITYYPCNLVGECYCKTPTAAPTLEPTTATPTEPATEPATVLSSVNVTSTVSGGEGEEESAEALFDDPRCGDPTQCFNTYYSDCFHATSQECLSPASFQPGTGGGGDGDKEDGEGEVQTEEVAAPVPKAVDPAVLEGLYVIEAHLAANKIALARDLLSGPGRRDAGFDYAGLRSALSALAVEGVVDGSDRKAFYVGEAGGDGRAYGLVNVVAFLAASARDSVLAGGCDEVNRDAIDGVLPLSNACGQRGRDYQDPEACPKYACAVDPTLRAEAGAVVPGERWDGIPPPPFSCGPKSDYGGTTGHWDYVSGARVDGATKNSSGKDHVEGCCWWGRGAVQIRGACAYGKLNYHLGKRAHDEGRPALYPDVDFCRDPQAVCSHPRHPGLRWAAGLYRWITEVQTYDRDGFDYLTELQAFVDGGMQNWTFAHGVAGIVEQGCHAPPCAGGVEFNGAGRMATFRMTLKLLGLLKRDVDDAGRQL